MRYGPGSDIVRVGDRDLPVERVHCAMIEFDIDLDLRFRRGFALQVDRHEMARYGTESGDVKLANPTEKSSRGVIDSAVLDQVVDPRRHKERFIEHVLGPDPPIRHYP